jgi:hypothetical protein
MPLSVYTVLHVSGLILMLFAVAAFLHHQATAPDTENPRKRALMIQHGVGLLIMLVAGFGALARLDIAFPYPAWVWIKMGIWLFFALVTRLAGKGGKSANMWWTFSLVAAITAAWLGITKPF